MTDRSTRSYAEGADVQLRLIDNGDGTYSTGTSDPGAGVYETVAASQTAQILGGNGATGDFLERLVIVPATTSPGAVTLLDGSTSIAIFAGGASSVADLKPFSVTLRRRSQSGPWKVTTLANVSVIATGRFS